MAVAGTGAEDRGLVLLAQALRQAGVDACLRAAFPLLRRLWPHIERELLMTGSDAEYLDPAALRGLIRAMEEFVTCPCDAHAAGVVDSEHLAMGASSYLLDASTGLEPTGGDAAAADWAHRVFTRIVQIIQGPFYAWPNWPGGSRRTGWIPGLLEAALERVSESELRAAIRAELLPWLLERADPLQERPE